MTIVNTSVLGADSLLGVKYVLTGQDFPGLEKTSLPAANGKSVYRNPFALPLAFSSQKDVNNPVFTGNPFAYQEAAYTQLLGKKLTLYKRVAYKKTVQAGKVTYLLNAKDKKEPALRQSALEPGRGQCPGNQRESPLQLRRLVVTERLLHPGPKANQ
ncbi:MAG: YfhO family protein, partial [Lactobacillus equicursoris]|uniref:YfhO family protein n=1 Tax=Lactobacillus equicursoris TaxID=420645 RepID=UPI0024332215